MAICSIRETSFLLSQGRKWASCSGRGRITFNSDILKQTRKFLHEVIVYELMHLKYPNHGKMFKALIRSYLK
jgi:predicted metal-dependent hydrolase